MATDTPPPQHSALPDVPGMPALRKATKACAGPCGRTLPATEEYFNKDTRRDDGWRRTCRDCRRNERQLAKNKQVHERVKDIDAQIRKHLEHAAMGGSTVPHSADLYEKITTLLGGVQGVSMVWVNQFLACEPGSQQRERMLNSYMKLSQHVTDTGVAKVPVDMMTNEELERELNDRLAKQQMQGVIDGTAVQHDEFDPEEDEYDDDEEDTEVDDEDDAD